MVAADWALLSFAALSALGLDTARAERIGLGFQRLSPRNETINYGILQTATDPVTDIPIVTPPTKPPSRGPPARGGSGGGGAAPVSASIDLGHHEGSQDSATSVEAPSLHASVASADRVSSSTSYPYPGGFGVGGTLTTDTNAPTRSLEPTRSSIPPNSGSVIGPPPADTRRPPKRPPAAATNGGSSPDAVDDPPSPSEPAVLTPPSRTPKTTKTGTGLTTSITLDFGHSQPSTVAGGNAGIGWNSTIFPPNATWTTSTTQGVTTDENGSTLPICAPSDASKQRTVYSVIYTSTITWYGNPEDYTPPFPPMTTPVGCMPPKSPLRLTFSYCTSTGTDSRYFTCAGSTSVVYTTASATLQYGPGIVQPTVVFITTDKNPAVVFSSIKTPNYGVSLPGTRAQIEHSTAINDPPITTPDYVSQNSQAMHGPTKASAQKPVTVAVQPTGVVINGHTFTDSPGSKTQTVVVDGQTFVINPTQVIGAGATVIRPTVTGGVFLPTPTSTNIEGLPVVVTSSSIAIIDGTSFTMGPTPVTVTIHGHTVSVGPSGVAVGTQTIPVSVRPSATEVVIAGGGLITAIGQSVVVIHGTTVTYGPGPSSETVIGDDTVTIGPSGVTVHGTTLGGPSAGSSDTQYEIVGGATITQVGASVVVIGSSTYTVGPGSGTTTTVIGGETVTIGPSGVAVSTYSIAYPFGPTTTITPGATGTMATAKPTKSKDAGSSLRPDWTWTSFLSCIAIGVMGLGI